jgi:hypothetical protein
MSSSSIGTPSLPNRWIIAIAAFFMQLALGAVYAWSVFLTLVIKLYHVTRAEGNLTFTLALVALGITAGFGGYFNNRLGPREPLRSACYCHCWWSPVWPGYLSRWPGTQFAHTLPHLWDSWRYWTGK